VRGPWPGAGSAAHSFLLDAATWTAGRAVARLLPPPAPGAGRAAVLARTAAALAAAGCAGAALTYPLRVVAVRMVAQLAGGAGYATPWQAAATVAAEAGAAGFYQGLGATCAWELCHAATVVVLGHLAAQYVTPMLTGRDDGGAGAAHDAADAFLSHGVAQMLGKLAYYPLEVARTLLATHGARTLRLAAPYASAPAALAALYPLVRAPAGLWRRRRRCPLTPTFPPSPPYGCVSCRGGQPMPLGLYRGHTILYRVVAAE
jgi:hypothetical protein